MGGAGYRGSDSTLHTHTHSSDVWLINVGLLLGLLSSPPNQCLLNHATTACRRHKESVHIYTVYGQL